MKVYIAILIFFISSISYSQLIDSFTDGEFTSNPVWGGDTGGWTIVTNSDVSTGATNSNTLRLNATAVAQQEYLSTQISTMSSVNGQSWSFFFGRRSQALTGSNNVEIWLYANENNLESSTVDGYALIMGEDTGDDEIRLARMTDGGVSFNGYYFLISNNKWKNRFWFINKSHKG